MSGGSVTSTISKSALKKHLRAKLQAQPPSGTRSAFREAEKRYLSRNPPPNYADVIDFSSLGINDGVVKHEVSDACFEAVFTLDRHPGLLIVPGFLNVTEQRCLIKECLRDYARSPNLNNLDTHYRLPPEGLWYHYENHINNPVQYADLEIKPLASNATESKPNVLENSRRLIEEAPFTADVSREVLLAKKEPAPPGTTLKDTLNSQLLYRLRWSNLGLMYHWTTKSYHYEEVFEKGPAAMIPVPKSISKLTMSLLEAVPQKLVPAHEDWQDFCPESGIINFYQLKDTLMGHVDQSELVEDKPLVSFSLGHTAVFLIGNITRDVTPTAIYLKSGDALIMSGACRRVFHGVPRIVEGTLPPYLDNSSEWPDVQQHSAEYLAEWKPFAEYLQTTRINVNIRQVLPKDFCKHVPATKKPM